MDALDLLKDIRDRTSDERVFGEPLVRDGVTVIPVVRVSGGGGAGSGEEHRENESPSQGSGGGFGFGAQPAGVYAVKDGVVRWIPAVDVNRLLLGAQVIAALGLLVLRADLRRRAGREALREASART